MAAQQIEGFWRNMARWCISTTTPDSVSKWCPFLLRVGRAVYFSLYRKAQPKHMETPHAHRYTNL